MLLHQSQRKPESMSAIRPKMDGLTPFRTLTSQFEPNRYPKGHTYIRQIFLNASTNFEVWTAEFKFINKFLPHRH